MVWKATQVLLRWYVNFRCINNGFAFIFDVALAVVIAIFGDWDGLNAGEAHCFQPVCSDKMPIFIFILNCSIVTTMGTGEKGAILVDGPGQNASPNPRGTNQRA